MSKIKSLLLASSVCIATVCINFPAHATERHLLEQTVSYEELGNVLRYRQSWVDYPAYTDRKIWGKESLGDVRTVQVHIHNLRSKIEPDPAKPIYLKNVWGKGYIFRPEGETEA